MKKLLIILVLLILLGGGGAAAWWFFLRPQEEGAEPVVEEAPPPVLSQIGIGPFPVSVIKDGSPTREFWFQINLTFDNPENQAWVSERLPLVQDTMIAELHGLLPRKIVEQEGYNPEFLRERLRKVLAEKYGTGRFYDVTIVNMEIRELK
ncbi:flagellar FliL protein [Dongia mobilis]|uniref:Flagellar FliL protein n=1 Tax=Dongia mobilis TaxID=578943 RepID=A0A4R6WKK0_9PROT|nr:flagellar basal body-associated FliL family protein [Dongia mobilis]TDQ80947.1 flagellar FliL protein [Dongia mobilis]